MSPQLSDLSRRMSIVTSEPARFDAYRVFVPEANLIQCEEQLTPADLNELLVSDSSLVIIINRPPLSVTKVVHALRHNQAGRNLYIVVVTPHDIEYRHNDELDMDVDDYIILGDNAQIPQLIETCVARYNRNIQHRDQFVDATRTAISALDSASEYGSLVHFFEISEKCQTAEALAEAVYHFLTRKQLHVNFIIDIGHQNLHWPRGGVSSARRNMLERMSESPKRMVSVDKLLGLNVSHFTLLISNAPADQPEKHGQLKDSLAQFCSIVESRIKDIMIRERLAQQHDEIVEIMNLIRLSTQESKTHIKRIMTNLFQEVELAATTFDMNQQEEEKLLQIANQASDSLYNFQENDQILETHFLSLIETLSSIQTLAQQPHSEPESGDDIELF